MRDRRRLRCKHVKPLQLAAQINTCSQGERATLGRICFYSLFKNFGDWVKYFFYLLTVWQILYGAMKFINVADISEGFCEPSEGPGRRCIWCLMVPKKLILHFLSKLKKLVASESFFNPRIFCLAPTPRFL